MRFLKPTLVLATILCSHVLLGNGPVTGLHLDGRFLHAAGPLSEARITLHHASYAPQIITPKRKMSLALPYQQEYLLVFEAPGHVSKTIHIDTHVPAELSHTKMDFKYQVTLDLAPAGYDTAYYTSPVGRIRFMVSQEDFDHDTTYDLRLLRSRFPSLDGGMDTPAMSLDHGIAMYPVAHLGTGPAALLRERKEAPASIEAAFGDPIPMGKADASDISPTATTGHARKEAPAFMDLTLDELRALHATTSIPNGGVETQLGSVTKRSLIFTQRSRDRFRSAHVGWSGRPG